MNSQKSISFKKRLQDASSNLEKEMNAIYEFNYSASFEDNDSQAFAKNYDIFFFEDYKMLIEGSVKRQESEHRERLAVHQTLAAQDLGVNRLSDMPY